MTRLYWLFGVVFLLDIAWSPCRAGDMLPGAFGFSSLIPQADLIVVGKVMATNTDGKTEHRASFRVDRRLWGSSSETIHIVAPLRSGRFSSAERYLEVDDRYRLVFLRRSSGPSGYSIVNRNAGVLNGDAAEDVARVIQIWAGSQGFSTRESRQALQNLFWGIDNPAVQSRMLEDLTGGFVEEDAPFLQALLSSDSKRFQEFATVQIGRNQIASLRLQVEGLLAHHPVESVRFHCLVGLGELGDARSRDLVLRYGSDSSPSIRKAAYHAAGLIGGEEIIEPLSARYGVEENKGGRLTIVEALERVPNAGRVRNVLSDFASMEQNDLLKRMIDNTIVRLSHDQQD